VVLLLAQEEPSGKVVGVLGPDCQYSPPERSSAALLLTWENQACWLAPSVTHGAVDAVCSAYIGVLVSLEFQGDGSRSCGRGDHGFLSSCVCWEAGFTLSVLSNETWSHAETSGAEDQED
jgi:hypothetical protein